MGRPIVTSVTLVAAVSNGIALSQSLGAAGALTLNGSLVTAGVASFGGVSRRVTIHSVGDDRTLTWTVVGTSRTEQGGGPQTETFAGANAGGDAVSTQDFATITSITGSKATASTVTAGTNGTASGPWVPWNQNNTDFQVSVVGYVTSGSPTWQVEYTYDDVFGTWLPANVPFPRPLVLSTMSGLTGTADGNFDKTIRASRLTLIAVGTVQLEQTQQGI